MFRALLADDNYEDRELLKLEIQRALGRKETDLRFYEAASIKQAMEFLKVQSFDLMTLDIEFDRMNEGIDALPEIFENYPTLNIIIISGKLNKAEVSEQLFRFTKDNIFKGKRWARHFDVLDKKDDKTEALQRAYSFALKQKEASGNLRDLFLLAESYLEKDELDKCLEVYQKIQGLAPGELESHENINIFKGGISLEQAMDYYRKGEKVIASLLLGHHLETRLKIFTRRILGRSFPGLYDCLKELERTQRVSQFKKSLFHKVLKIRNKAIHSPTTISEEDFDMAAKDLKLLEAKI
ncbi:MAG: response regulator [Nitrospirae bacterium]|nr:MAG: response regulator [Nitrospirota bacterium]